MRCPPIRALLALLLTVAVGGNAFCEEPNHSGGAVGNSILVLTRAPGLSAPDIETAITNPLERRLIEAQGVRKIESRTFSGLSAIRLSFRPDISLPMALALVDAHVHGVAGELPADAAAPYVMAVNFGATRPIGYIVVADENAQRAAQAARTRLFLPLNGVPGMPPLVIVGDRPRQTVLRLNRVKLLARGVTAGDVRRAIERYSPPPISSVFRTGGTAFAVSFSPPMNAAEIAAVPLGGKNNRSTLRDVAQVAEAALISPRSFRIDGVEKVVMPIYASSGDAKRIGDAVRQIVDEANGNGADAKFKFLPISATGEPQSDDGLITIELRLFSGMRVEAAQTRCAMLEQMIRHELADDVACVITELGVDESWPAAFSFPAAECDATLRVRLSDQRKRTTAEAVARISELLKAPQTVGANGQFFVRTSAIETIEARVVGQPAEARRHLESFLTLLHDSFPQARIVERLDGPSYQLSVDWLKAADLGLAPTDIHVPLAALTAGPSAAWINRQTGLRVQLAYDEEVASLDDLLNIPIGSESQRPIPLGNIVTLRRANVPVEIEHVNLQPLVRAEILVEHSRRQAAISKLTIAAAKFTKPGVGPIEVTASENPAPGRE